MRFLRVFVTGATLLLVTLSARAQKQTHDYPVQPVPFTAVRLTDVFWAPRIETNRKVTIPAAFQKCEETGRVNNFERAAQALRGEAHDTKAPATRSTIPTSTRSSREPPTCSACSPIPSSTRTWTG